MSGPSSQRALVAPFVRTLVALGLLGATPRADASEPPAMPEPLLGESVTDLDGLEAGELELELTGLLTPPRTARGGGWQGSMELEWRALERLGLMVEVGMGGGLGRPELEGVSARAAGSWMLLHDVARGLHVQAELGARLLSEDEEAAAFEPGEATLPLWFGLRAGWRQGAWTVRAGLGGQALGRSAHLVPLRANLSALGQVGPWSFLGVELEGDWARASWLVVAPTALVDLGPVELPVRLGLAVPWSPARSGRHSETGFMLRLVYELDRD
ncbi:hypothetical protein [Archangium sp.]|uniref:hypothetical protein n=1 Tax=Archangium sp. TaxID=1872627 RepID=UPI00389B07CD